MAGDAGDPVARVRFARRGRTAVDADDGRADGRRRVAVPDHEDHAGLDLGDELRAHVRARARNRLRAVHRAPLPRRVLRLQALSRGGDGGDDGHRRQGRPVLRRDRPDLALGGDARPEPRVPLDEPRDHARGAVRARRDADAAARGAREARPQGRQARAAVGALGRAPLRQVRRLGRAAVEATARLRRDRARDPRRARDPGHPTEDRDAVDQGRPDLRQLTHRLPAGTGRDGTRLHRPAADRHTRESGHPGRPDRPARPGPRGGDAGADLRRLRADHGDPQAGSVQPRRRPDDRPPPHRAPVRFA